MKIKQTILLISLFIGIGSVLVGPSVYADGTGSCQYVKVSIIPCNDTCPDGASAGTDGYCSDGKTKPNGIWGLLSLVLNILTGGVAVVAVGGVIYGAIMYTSAEGSAEQTKKARMIIANVMIGLTAYALMYVFLNYIIPGGIFS